ncbi:hypothetical protein ACQFX9_28715 [Aliinostoc sp. HNIBRCY26]|uniref:hypothetical protein n=1 Tax=Aliinostoc sp. HNIBRCY26 TaxID=3418997 RepID=UPI003D053FB8
MGLSFAISQPASANINCESGTVITHSNGSLYTCLLSQKATVQLSYNYGISTFPCQAQSYILFDVNGQFQRCQLAEDIQIQRGNSVERCPTDFWVDVSIPDKGNIAINCRQY